MLAPGFWQRPKPKTVEGVLAGIDRGCVTISYAPDGPFIELSCGAYRMGDSVPMGGNRFVRLQAEQLHEGDEVKIISSDGLD